MVLPMVRQAHHEDEHKLTMRGDVLQILNLILSLSKDEAKISSFFNGRAARKCKCRNRTTSGNGVNHSKCR